MTGESGTKMDSTEILSRLRRAEAGIARGDNALEVQRRTIAELRQGGRDVRGAEELLRQAKPDLIVLTGDLLDNDGRLAAQLARSAMRRIGCQVDTNARALGFFGRAGAAAGRALEPRGAVEAAATAVPRIARDIRAAACAVAGGGRTRSGAAAGGRTDFVGLARAATCATMSGISTRAQVRAMN